MESNPTPDEAAAALADAERSGARLAAGLRLPRFFHGSLALVIALQIATSAVGIAVDETWARLALGVGLAAFVLVGAGQLLAFRRSNGAWVAGLASRVVLGTDHVASLTYCAAFGAAVWAALAEAWWLVPVASVAGGVGYGLSGRRWVRGYRGDPSAHSRAESVGMLAATAALALSGLVLLAVGR
jgi:hypothetical protein